MKLEMHGLNEELGRDSIHRPTREFTTSVRV